jgi:hypothetical protein
VQKYGFSFKYANNCKKLDEKKHYLYEKESIYPLPSEEKSSCGLSRYNK